MSTANKMGLILLILGIPTFRDGGVMGCLGVIMVLFGILFFLLKIEDF